MLKKILLNISKIGNVVLSWFNFCMFFAMRPCWSGISKKLGCEDGNFDLLYNLPVIIWIALFVIALGTTLLFILMRKEKNLWSYILNGVNAAFFIAVLVIVYLGALDYMDYIWPNFFKYVGIAVFLLALIYLIFFYPKSKLANSKVFKISIISVVSLFIVLNIVDFTFNSIQVGAVVYAVEDEYQIVFSSATNSRAWVKVGDIEYYDNYAGSNRSYTKIHKVSVPMAELNAAKEYEIHVQKITYEGPFGGWFGRDISEKYEFTPINTSDGLNYYSLSDIHMAGSAAAKAASYDEGMELLVLAGDIVSMMDTFYDANLVNQYAHNITNGRIPVIYARGNHEIKGKYSEELHRFVGAKGEDFYYNVKLNGLYGIVLDMGEDHEDEYWEYYHTAQYDLYREEQVKFVQKEYESNEFINYDYRLVVCHIPVTFINSRGDHVEPKTKLTEVLNKMNINMMISGHQHDLYVFEPGLELSSSKLGRCKMTDHNFLNILVSKRGPSQFKTNPLTDYSNHIGMTTVVDFTNNIQTCVFNDSYGNKINIENEFSKETLDYGTELVFDLTTGHHI